jgi:ABC-2 type transport system permease protein
MRATASLIRREIGAYFLSPIAYVVLSVFLVATGLLFMVALDQLTTRGPKGIEFPLQVILGNRLFWVVFLVFPALLTMRLFAEESSTGTLEMLMTAPLRDWQVVLSKYAASFAFYLMMWVPTLLYLPVLLGARTAEGPVDPMPLWSSMLGLVLVGGMFLSVGILVSSLVPSQLVAALVSLLVSLFFVVGGVWRFDSSSPVASFFRDVLDYLSVPVHFDRDFSRGIVDSRHLILYVSVTVFCLFLTVRSLESRRWR